MKKYFLLLLIFITASCGRFPMTSFYVKNNSDQPVHFNATVIKYSGTLGSYPYNQSFDVAPRDSILARRIGFKKNGGSPQSWFTAFDIAPVAETEFNDPTASGNWKRYSDAKGKPFYTFQLVK